ncbi:MAG: sigma-70 family RNA polymerase sigma factor [Aeromicrobium sp.]
MNAPSGEAGPPDAQLVAGVLGGDREAFATVYDRYGDRLYDFANSMLRQREEAEDAVADSFVIVVERISQLRDPDRLRPWLYAIVRSECLRRLKARKRIAYGGEDRLVDMADESMSPESEAQKSALRDLVWDASAGLADRDRALLDLHLRQGLEGAELGEAMGVNASNAYVMLNRLRGQVERSLGALLIARLGREECDELDGMLVDWDGRFSPLVRKRVARHVDNCDVCTDRRRRIVSPWALLAGVPLVAAPLSLRDRVVNDTQLVAYSGPTGGAGMGSRRRNQALAAGAAAVVIAGTVFLWPSGADDSASAPTAAGEQVTPTPTVEPSVTESSSPTPAEDDGTAATLTVSTRVVDLGRDRTTASVGLTNTGDEEVAYRVTTSTPWLTVSPASGTLTGGRTGSTQVTANRSEIAEGAARGTLTITWDGGSAPVTVRLVQERPPTVGQPSLGGSKCGPNGRTVTVSAAASDESRLDSVVLGWTGPSGSGSAKMSASGSRWSTAMGPFPVGGKVTLKVTAADERANSMTGPSTTTGVDPCPQ